MSGDFELVSIIIPTFNRADLIGDTLDSVAAQTYPHWECVVVDDGSTDETGETVLRWTESDSRFQFHISPDSKPKGANACRNYGLNLSQGSFVNFLDSDDRLVPSKLVEQIAAFDADPTLDLVTSKHQYFGGLADENVTPLVYAREEAWLEAIWLERRFGTLWNTNSGLWKRSVVVALGGWNETVKNWQDHELNLRALLSGYKVERLDRVLNLVRCGNRNRIFENNAKYWNERRRSLLIGWGHLEAASAVTAPRKKAAVCALIDCGKRQVRHHRRMDAIRGWLEDSKKIQLPFWSRLSGALLLLIQSYRRMTRLRSWLEERI